MIEDAGIVATKADLQILEGSLRAEITDIRGRLRLHNWILVINLAGTIAILLKLLL